MLLAIQKFFQSILTTLIVIIHPVVTLTPAITTPSPTPLPIPTNRLPTPITLAIKPTLTAIFVGDTRPWGISTQIDEHTWTMKITMDNNMSTEKELLEAINNYRQVHGSSRLNLDDKLSAYAKTRAQYFSQIKNLDGHKGFNDYLSNQDGFNKLGFTQLGENASYGYRLSGVHLIEWIYAGDEPHDKNQLNTVWNYVGVGIDGTSSCIIFATGKN